MYNMVDIAALVLILLGILQGLRRGLSGELAHVFSIIVAVLAGRKFYAPIGEHIYGHTTLSEPLANASAFVLCIAVALLIMYALSLLLQTLLEFTFKGKIERIGGAICGCLRLSLIVSAFIFFMGLLPSAFLQEHFAEESLLGRLLCRNLESAREAITENIPALQHDINTDDEVLDKGIENEYPNEDVE